MKKKAIKPEGKTESMGPAIWALIIKKNIHKWNQKQVEAVLAWPVSTLAKIERSFDSWQTGKTYVDTISPIKKKGESFEDWRKRIVTKEIPTKADPDAALFLIRQRIRDKINKSRAGIGKDTSDKRMKMAEWLAFAKEKGLDPSYAMYMRRGSKFKFLHERSGTMKFFSETNYYLYKNGQEALTE